MPRPRIRSLRLTDLEPIKNILLNWDDAKRVNLALQKMRLSLDGSNTRKYFVAENRKQVLGVIGMMDVRIELQSLTPSSNPIELTSLFIDPKMRKHGVGTILVGKLEKEAKDLGYTEIILESSVPRKKVAWGFYDQLKGYKRLAQIEHSSKKYQVWHKLLN